MPIKVAKEQEKKRKEELTKAIQNILAQIPNKPTQEIKRV